jgi:hypothetical protein
VFLYFANLLFIAALVLFVAIVSPVMLSFISFTNTSIAGDSVSRKQDIFLQTLRSSVDKNFF